jgi:hypothetical protein
MTVLYILDTDTNHSNLASPQVLAFLSPLMRVYKDTKTLRARLSFLIRLSLRIDMT